MLVFGKCPFTEKAYDHTVSFEMKAVGQHAEKKQEVRR
jgi:hypothetical protein